MTTYEQKQRAALEAMAGMPETVYVDGSAYAWLTEPKNVPSKQYVSTSVMNEKLNSASDMIDILSYKLTEQDRQHVSLQQRYLKQMEQIAALRSKLEAAEKALEPFAAHYYTAHKAFNGDPVQIGDVCRGSVSSFDFKTAADTLSQIRDTNSTRGEEP